MTLDQKMDLFFFFIQNQDASFYTLLRFNISGIFKLLLYYTTPQQIYELTSELIAAYK